MLYEVITALTVDDPQYEIDNAEIGETNPNVIHPGDDVNVWIKITNDNYDKQLKDITVEISRITSYNVCYTKLLRSLW